MDPLGRRPAPAPNLVRHNTVTYILLGLSLFLNILLAREVRNVRNALIRMKGEGVLTPGTVVPPLKALDVNGQVITISYSQSTVPTVLYVFTPPCGWCRRNIPNVRALADGVHGRYDFYGLSLSSQGLTDYVSKYELGFPILRDAATSSISAYRLGGTPQTIVVSPDGRVLRTWMGAYTAELRQDIEKFFGVRLPGLIEDDVTHRP